MNVLVIDRLAPAKVMRVLLREADEVRAMDLDEPLGWMLETFRPDLVVIATPAALDVCRAVRRADQYVPVIALVPGDDVEDRIACLGAGADVCLATPFNEAELVARMLAVRRRYEVSASHPQSVHPQTGPSAA